MKGKIIPEKLKFLIKLLEDIESEALVWDFVRILRKQPAELIEHISDSDSDEVILTKVIHKVRIFAHFFLNKVDVPIGQVAKDNIDRLRKFHEEVTKFQPRRYRIKRLCQSFILDLKNIERNLPDHLDNADFCENLAQLYEKTFSNMIIARNSRAGGRGRGKAGI